MLLILSETEMFYRKCETVVERDKILHLKHFLFYLISDK